MPGFDVSPLAQVAVSPGHASGLLMGLDPTYQGQQLALAQARAFQDGVPTDANGNPDYQSMAMKLLQLGDRTGAASLLQTGIQQQGLRYALSSANDLTGGVNPSLSGASMPGTGQGPQASSAGGSSQLASGSDPMAPFRNAIAGVESKGSGDYTAIGQQTKNGDVALGRYQVMASNVPSWTQDVLGQSLTPQQFLASPQAQDAVFNAKFGGYLKQYGNPKDAASAWFTGKPLSQGGSQSDGNIDGNGYVSRFMANLQGGQPSAPMVSRSTAEGTPGGPAVMPDQVAQAQARLAANENTDPATLTFAQQRQLTADTDTVEAYRQQQSAGPVRIAQNGLNDAPSSVHPFGPQVVGGRPGADQPSQLAQPGTPQPMPGSVPTGSQATLAPGQGGPQPTVLPQPQPSVAAVPSAASPAGPLIDPTMGGLLRGQWVGNPGGYVSALRARQATLGTLGQKAAADAFGKQADMVENALARSDITTPNMKDWQIARQNGYQGTPQQYAIDQAAAKAQVEAQARLQGDTDPSRIQFAGQEAQARAAGTQQGENSPSAIAARAQNAATVGEAKEQGETLGKMPQQLAASADSARQQNSQVDSMLDAANQFNMGQYAPARAAFQARLSDLGKQFGVDTSSIDGPLAGYQEFGKLAGQLSRAAMKDTGSNRGGFRELQMIQGTLPSPTMSMDGFKGVAAQIKGMNDFTIAKQEAAQLYAAPDGPGKGSMSGFDAAWNKNVGPTAFVLHRMQVDQPQLFATTVQRLGQSPQGRAVLQNAKAGLQWANSQGLLD